MGKYFIDTEVATIDIDGEEWVILLNTIDYGSREAKHWASEGIDWLEKRWPNVVLAMKRSDGTYGLACSGELEERIRARISPELQWKKVRLYPPPDWPSKLNGPL
jgi:hypothetical protein